MDNDNNDPPPPQPPPLPLPPPLEDMSDNSSSDSDYVDARDNNTIEDVDSNNSPPPPAPPSSRHDIDNQPEEEGHDHHQVNNPLQSPPPPDQQLGVNVNAQDIVRQVIDNLWPILGGGDNPEDDEDEDQDGMDNVHNGYFEEDNDEDEDEEEDEGDQAESGNSPTGDDNHNQQNGEQGVPMEFDLQLPARHSYLGDGMEELQGRVVFEDDGPTPEIPLVVMGLLLVPGQTLPLSIFHPVFQNAIRRCVMTNRVFGIVHNDLEISAGSTIYKGAFGTIAEIYEFQEEHEPINPNINFGNMSNFALKAKGRQRFNVISFRRQADGNLMGTVKIRPEIRLSPMIEATMEPSTHRLRFPVKRRIEIMEGDDMDTLTSTSETEIRKRKLSKCLSSGSTTSETEDRALADAELGKMREHILEQRKKLKFYSAFTTFPYFVYEQYDEQVLVEKMHRKLRLELRGLTDSSRIPKDANDLSYWVAQNLTMDDHHRINLLKMDTSIQRLKYELDLLSRATKVIVCRHCQSTIAENAEIFSMSVEGPQGTYVNPHGFVHETLTVHRTTRDVTLRGHSSTEASWFPGYSWTIAECRRCASHLGWKFKAVTARLIPTKFWGLARRSITFKYNFLTEEEAQGQGEGLNNNVGSNSQSSQPAATVTSMPEL